MFFPKIYLKDIAEPLQLHTLTNSMKVYSEDLSLDGLEDFDFGSDIALKNQDGKILSWVPHQVLVNELFRAFQKSQAFYHTLLSLLSSTNDAVTGINSKGEIIVWNSASESYYGFSTEEVLNRPITNFFQEEAIMVTQAIRREEIIENKYNQPVPNIHVIVNAKPVYINGQIVGGIILERDISDLVRLNEELANTKAYIYDLENKYEKDKLQDPFIKIKGKSRIIRETIAVAKKVSKTDATVLITGESGVGKELFAEAIHHASNRAEMPFVAINCGAIPASLFESELFGYEKGTFTGANKEGKKGKLELAQGGTLFLDEVGELPFDLQVKLLRVLQEKSYYRLGGNKPIAINVRVITATNRNLERMVENGQFREDLFYRLNVISLYIPPLRERQGDIPELLSLFLQEFSSKYGTPVPRISKEVVSTLVQEEWRGNIRQLRNVAERLIILTGEEEVIELRHLPGMFNKPVKKPEEEQINTPPNFSEEETIRAALQKTYNNKSAAAKLLGISRATLYNKMLKYGIQ